MASRPRAGSPLRLLGRSRGAISGLTPRARIACGALALAACMIPDARTAAGMGTVAITTLAWLAATGAPARMVGGIALLGVSMLGPILALTPLVDAGDGGPPALAVTLAIVAKGLCCMTVATVATSTMTLAEIQEGLAGLPLPRIVAGIVVQIVLQAGMLSREASRIAEAMAVRRAARGLAVGLSSLAGIPSAWLPRLLFKVERVASAMAVRGFDGTDPPAATRAPGVADRAAVLVALAWALATAGTRLWGTP